ncbi:MAG: Pvc16 family protein [Mariprofundaceae bacterium]
MTVPVVSSLSEACVAIRDFLQDNLETPGADRNPNVYFGAPKNSFENYEDEDDWINLFFYCFEPFEFNADVLSGETAWLRIHCLVTPVAKKIKEDDGIIGDTVSEGEQDLRLLGEVIRVFHEYPQQVIGEAGQEFYFQAIFESLTVESINQIWSTQGSEIAYRPSVGYEFALAPVIPRKKAEKALLVGATGFRVDGNTDHAGDTPVGDHYTGIVQTPDVVATTVNSGLEAWMPALCFISAGECAQSLLFAESDINAIAHTPKLDVWLAGKTGEDVQLMWDVWDSQAGWVSQDAGSLTVVHDGIDPQNVIAVPDKTLDMPLESAGQAVLYAVHSYTRLSDGADLTVRSNPILITVYEDSAP